MVLLPDGLDGPTKSRPTQQQAALAPVAARATASGTLADRCFFVVISSSGSQRSSIMFNRVLGLTALLAVAPFFGAASAEEPKSGRQAGEKVVPFHPLNCTGDHSGEKYCLICKNGDNPVAMIFARQVSPELTKLIKRIDQATGNNKERNMGSFVVLLSESGNLEKELKELAKKEKIRHCILTIDNPEGPQDYNIAEDAEVTVILYTKLTVKVNHTFKNGELNDKAIEAIIADLGRILPK
jgi:hypothetical protein